MSEQAKPEGGPGPCPQPLPDDLVYTTDREPGYRRRKRGEKFVYLTPAGAVLRQARELARIARLAIPPAYTDVWICLDARGHLQATGRDSRGRKQYRYHERWRAIRDASKFHRLLEFARHLPALRARVQKDLALPGLPKQKVLAAVVRLLETTAIRVGNEEYSRSNASYGLTTMRSRHAHIRGDRVRFRFRGKAGRFHSVDLDDSKLVRIVRKCQELPGQLLFQFLDEQDSPVSIDSVDVNDYIRMHSAHDFSAKDFRTWSATVLAARELVNVGFADGGGEAKARVAAAMERVADALGNTPAVCRKCYVHPAVFEAYLDHSLRLPAVRRRDVFPKKGLSPDERALVRLLSLHERDGHYLQKTR